MFESNSAAPFLLPCPFCGTKAGGGDYANGYREGGPSFKEDGRADRILNRLGKTREHAWIRHHISCDYCGAEGPSGLYFMPKEDDKVLPEHVAASMNAVAVAWNARPPIDTDRAFELVNKLIASAIAAIDS